MLEFKFFGRVEPSSHTKISFQSSHGFRWIAEEDIDVTMNVIINLNDVEVTCTSELYNDRIFNKSLTAVREIIRTVVNLYVFATGSPFTVEIYEAQPPDGGNRRAIKFENDDLAALCTAFQLDGPSLNSAIRAVFDDYVLMTVLNDLAMATTVPQYQAIACGRALDGIRNYIAPESSAKGKQRQGFERVARELNLGDAYARFVTELARKPRHREPSNIRPEEINETMRRTWAIMNRVLIYCQRGKTKLTAPEFPPL